MPWLPSLQIPLAELVRGRGWGCGVGGRKVERSVVTRVSEERS